MSRQRVLIVTSAYMPTMIADMQRARHLAWSLPACGWDVEVLAPGRDFQDADWQEPDAAGFFSPHVPCHFASPVWTRLFALLHIRSIGWRALPALWRLGGRLFRQRPFDLVYISTAQFPLFLLGFLWRRQHHLPYVLDIHDPLVREGRRRAVSVHFGLRHTMARGIARWLERVSVRSAAGIVSVSAQYLGELRERHARSGAEWLRKGRAVVIPFGFLQSDFEPAGDGAGGATAPTRIVYTGVGGPVMARGFAILCQALAHLRARAGIVAGCVVFEFYGTMRGWREGQRKDLAAIASSFGVDAFVQESPQRISYRRSMQLLAESDGALVLGVDDPGYMPSKLFTVARPGKPVLAIGRKDGPLCSLLADQPSLGRAIWFTADAEMPAEEATSLLAAFLSQCRSGERTDRTDALKPYSAPEMAARHAGLFSLICRP